MDRHSTRNEASDKIAIVDEFFDGVFTILEEWEPRVRADLEAHCGGGSMSDAQLAQLVEAESLRILEQPDNAIYGAGFCASEAVLAEGTPLAWWQGPDRRPLASSTFGVGPGAVDLRRLEWYRVPELTGKRSIVGPFVDYLCSNEVTITSSLPVFLDGAFAGVLCLDVLLSEFEDLMYRRLTSDQRVTVYNDNRRIVVSTDVTQLTGDRVDLERLEAPGAQVAHSSRYPFAVLVD